jgi:hypothetical protein
MTLSRSVFNVPMQDDIKVVEAIKTTLLGYSGIKSIPNAIISEPKAMGSLLPTVL